MKKLLILLLLVPTLAMSGTFKDDEGKSSYDKPQRAEVRDYAGKFF